MRTWQTKSDNQAPAPQGELDAAEDNARGVELNNAVTTAGVGPLDAHDALSDTDLYQLAQAIARYASGGIACQDSGAANAYVLASIGSFIMPKAYFDGMEVEFYPGNPNTGPSAVNAFSIGSVPLLSPYGLALEGGEVTTRLARARYDGNLTAFRLNPWSVASAAQTGKWAFYSGTSAPPGSVRANGRTIGSLASGATERAKADTLALYVLHWNSYDNTRLAIQDSSGGASSRGGNAVADFNANKRLPLPDARGRALMGLDDMGNTAASRLGVFITSPTVNGFSGGSESSTISTGNMPAHVHGLGLHTHTFSGATGFVSADHTHSGTTGGASADHTHSGTTDNPGTHTHTSSPTVTGGGPGNIQSGTGLSLTITGAATPTSGAGAHTHNMTTGGVSADHTHTVTTGGISANHTHTFSGTTGAAAGNTDSAGSGTAFSNMPPCWLGTYIINL